MIAIIAGILVAFFAIYAAVFPDSPFGQLALSDAYDTALGWLNWVVPVYDMVTLFVTWVGVIMACAISFVVIKYSIKFGMKLSGV